MAVTSIHVQHPFQETSEISVPYRAVLALHLRACNVWSASCCAVPWQHQQAAVQTISYVRSV
eukprot:703582-Amphidinium_carterae.1